MKARDYFILGCKLFGVWCLFQGFAGLIGTIPTFLFLRDLKPEIQKIYMVTTIVSRLIPVLFIVVGIYLLRGGSHLYKFAYPNETEEGVELEEKFTIFVKMLGLFLLVNYFPDFLRTISNYFVYSNALRYLDLFQERQFVYTNAASSIGGVLFGIYLLRSGKFFVRIGLKAIQIKNKDDKQDMA